MLFAITLWLRKLAMEWLKFEQKCAKEMNWVCVIRGELVQKRCENLLQTKTKFGMAEEIGLGNEINVGKIGWGN